MRCIDPVGKFFSTSTAMLLIAMLFAVCAIPAHALPSFAQQTGQPCVTCHIGSFGPQLTPFGRAFKLQGYALPGASQSEDKSQGSDKSQSPSSVPVAAMLVTSFTQTKTDQPDNAGAHDGRNDNFSMQEASLFLAGHLSDHIGTFVQATYSDIDRLTTLDNVDVRYARTLTLAGKPATVGVSLNNNPTVQDAWNTLPAWRFPYMASELVPGQVAAPLLDGGLEHQVLGLSGYAYFNSSLYAELGGYRSLSHGFLDSLNVEDTAGRIQGLAPYWRLVYTQDLATQSWSAGVFGLNAKLEPGRIPGPTDNYQDVGIDASYQFLGTGKHVFSANGAYIHEHRTLNASFAAGATALRAGSLDSMWLNASYYYDSHFGLTVGGFDLHGSRDEQLFAPGPAFGSRTGKPDSRGTILQVDWTPFGQSDSWAAPFANMRLGLQYTWYDKFNGAARDYDGFGRNAHDNDTLFAFLWMAL